MGIALFELIKRQERNFLESLRTETTRKSYAWYFSRYEQFVSKKLIHEDVKIIEDQIIDFLLFLKNKGLSYNHIKLHFTAILHFYTMNDIMLNRKKIAKFVSIEGRNKAKNQAYSSEQIHKLLEISDERTKVIILLFASTGMRLGALPYLEIGNLKKIIIEESTELYQITVYQGYKEEYITFCTPECVKVIDSYLSYRQRSGEQLRDNSPLIREQFDSSDPLKVKYPKFVGIETIVKTLRLKLIQAGIRNESRVGSVNGARIRKDVQLIHGFRKFFNTACMNADVTYSFKELLMGHSVKLDDFYYDKNNQKSRAKLLEEYCKAIDYLTISEENRLRKRLESEKQKEDRVSVLEKQMQSLILTLSKMTEQGQVNAVAQTLYSSGILKEGNEGKV